MPKPNKMFFGLAALTCLSLVFSACSSNSGNNLSTTKDNSETASADRADMAPDMMDGRTATGTHGCRHSTA